ncbi:MAG: adenylate kinase [Bdellovibrionales bacterium RIFOXYC1_FULL_54_43]|nr:MAG: adenylate kinase [Bdellovibrionales bacterium RIFOXYC1_FULL_54_43]OFZ80319.1 MAG: adenylate kinase [Bdellovibrionales bacterium RIFOXYD1_FULL_55_31]
MILVLLGPPGSGKGTQAKKIVRDRDWPQLSTGDMLRAAIAAGTALGREAKRYMDSGSLVPDQVVIGLIRERTEQPDAKAGFILDGFPRTVPQAQALDQMLQSRASKVDRVVLFEIPDEELVRRLSGRRTCLKCGAMYHIENAPPEKKDVCGHCGSELTQRDDDRPEIISKRLKVYHEQTAPVAEYYRKQSKLRTLDALKSPDEVSLALAETLAR